MTIDTDGLTRLLDRFGLPTLYLALLAWLAWMFVKGPAMVLAAKLGDGAGVLARSGAEFLGRLTASMEATHVEHEQARSHAAAGVADVKDVVRSEGAMTREHVTDAIYRIHDRVSAAETAIEATVRQETGSHSACQSPRATMPTLPESRPARPD